MHVMRAAVVTRLVSALSAAALLVGGCTSMHHVSTATPTADAPWAVNVGDTVRLTMRDGRQHDLTIRTIDASAIVRRDGTSYDVTDIQSVEHRQFSGIKTTFLAVGLFASAILVAMAAMMGSLMGAP
jgi:plastocyanin